jgi:hypothetical protein
MLPQPTFRRTTHIKGAKETLNCNWHLRNPFSRSCPSAPLLVTCVSVRFMSVFLRMELDLISQENDLLPAEQLRFDYRKINVLMFRAVFWDILPCKIIVDRRFRGATKTYRGMEVLSTHS